MDDPEEPRPPSASQLSKTPSWVMLGFVLGALVVLALPRPEKKAAPPPVVIVPPPAPPQPLTVERAVFFEDVFAELNRPAVWQDDRTEVAFWNAERRAFSDCFEVLQVNDKFYFRSIPHLTRPVLKEGVPPDSPLQFTVPAGGVGVIVIPGERTLTTINRIKPPPILVPAQVPVEVPRAPPVAGKPDVEIPQAKRK